ncbi:hypothetical protein Ssi03_42000 [Sphaerisporangium siamense]|uniref:Uncharacterized protein n=1 Tax=Sphaerisporangium siamense TaxID=795645 RepID=A0A7W7DDG4_9ACTN|nr:hypothetical protein [Sphaerisporangium siamense]MBB4704596.1 hypothetical protein [Sphaerisporangium siamense]GII86210.1 hypothetical protein Ssi03_42000 [Sphaerisporangium siamense]
MRDVSAEVLALQPLPLFRRGPAGEVEADPGALLPGGGLRKFAWKVLDKAAGDGIGYHEAAYGPGHGKDAAGRAFALERDSGTTRLFFVWLPGALAGRLSRGALTAPLNFHVLFHPPTYEGDYTGSRPYWRGKLRADGVPYYVKLGIRYLCQDFKSVAHHVMAVTERDPNLAYVVPVADVAGNFADLLTPAGMLGALADVYRSLTTLLKGPAQFDRPGAVMLSAYSRSGDRLVQLMRQVGRTPFFIEHLTQWNGFDINLGDNDAQRLPELARLWTATRQWAQLNRRARAYLYTSYRSHYNQCLGDPEPGGRGWTDRADLDLEDVSWSDGPAKKVRGQARGLASEAYGSDARFGLVCLPVSFFRFYLLNHDKNGNEIIVGNQQRGWHDGDYDIGRAHGHGLFLRGMMSHALAHADPLFFTAKGTK